MRREILFLAHRIPFPPNRGDKIRSHHLLQHLARIAPVHVATFADDDADMAQEIELATLAASYRLVRRSKPLLLAGMRSLFTGKPVSLEAFRDAALATYLRQTLNDRPIGTIFVFSGQMGQYVPGEFAGRIIADFVDVDSAKFEAYAQRSRGPFRWVYAREGRLLREEESRIAGRAAASLLISHDEAALFASRLPPRDRKKTQVRVLRNGIDSISFDPARVVAEPRLQGLRHPRIIFTGQMDYPPNVQAAIRGAVQIMPLVLDQCPSATFHIVGRNPTDKVRKLDGINRTTVWGSVDDVRPWLKASDLALIPLEIARGVQNKVLEAMSMGLPIVLTSAAATGIPAENGKHFLVGESAGGLAQAVCKLAADKGRARAIGEAARRIVVDCFGWEVALADLPEIVDARHLMADDAS